MISASQNTVTSLRIENPHEVMFQWSAGFDVAVSNHIIMCDRSLLLSVMARYN